MHVELKCAAVRREKHASIKGLDREHGSTKHEYDLARLIDHSAQIHHEVPAASHGTFDDRHAEIRRANAAPPA